MSESAAHLVDQVFPHVPVRQWVLSFPMSVRFILARHPRLQSKALSIVHRGIATYLRKKAKCQDLDDLKGPCKPGAVTLIQRFGGSLNLNVHFHMLFLEGAYFATPDGPRFYAVPPPTDEEVKRLVRSLAKRVVQMLKKQGYFCEDEEAGAFSEQDQGNFLSEIQAASVQSKVALGERKHQRVRGLGAVLSGDAMPELKGRLCAQVNGFSLHAAVACEQGEKEKLEKLCRYITRPAVAEERLSLTPSGQVVLRLKRAYSNGTSHLLFSGIEFVEKLAALVPPPRIHLTRYFGCLAPHSKIRAEIVPKPKNGAEQGACEHACQALHQTTHETTRATPSKLKWAELLARVFSIDMKHCSSCGGELKILAAILETDAIHKILTHLDLPFRPPDIAPAVLPAQMEMEF